MAVLEIALVYCFANEGGVSQISSDHGGLTNLGVTQATLSSYLGRPATDAEVKGLTQVKATDVYRKLYWNVIKGDAIADQGVATVYMDMAVNMGPAQATKIVQSIVGGLADGISGPKTLAALNAFDPKMFVVAFSQKVCMFYGGIVARDVTQMQFLVGWQIRAHRMIKDVLMA